MIKVLLHKKGINKYKHNDRTYSYVINNNLLSIILFKKYRFYFYF